MTPEEILRDLRDIHIPEQTAGAPAFDIILWPAGVVLSVALIAGLVIWRRRSAWRRDALKHLDKIEQEAVSGELQAGWTALAVLLRRLAVKTSDRPGDVAGLVGQAWLEKLDQIFGTDTFEHGPGRAVVDIPYAPPTEISLKGDAQHIDDLMATIVRVRKRVPYLRPTR